MLGSLTGIFQLTNEPKSSTSVAGRQLYPQKNE
jgi:hypothetical protein